jgi:hypothetical protein
MNTEHYVKVGDALVQVNALEWFIVHLPPNTPVEWFGAKWEKPSAGVGIFLYSWFYDGVVAEIDANGRRLALHPATNPDLCIRVLEDTSRLCCQGMHGDGI